MPIALFAGCAEDTEVVGASASIIINDLRELGGSAGLP